MTANNRRKATKPTSVAEWKKKNQVPLLELPSGMVMRIRKVGMQTLMSTGIMPNSLLPLAQKAVAKGQGEAPVMSEDDMIQMIQDPKAVQDIVVFMDKMVCIVAAEPEIHPLPKDGVERDDDLLYVDEVAEEDKMFIFQVVTGGTTDVEQFRQEAGSTMAAIRGREDLGLPTE